MEMNGKVIDMNGNSFEAENRKMSDNELIMHEVAKLRYTIECLCFIMGGDDKRDG